MKKGKLIGIIIGVSIVIIGAIAIGGYAISKSNHERYIATSSNSTINEVINGNKKMEISKKSSGYAYILLERILHAISPNANMTPYGVNGKVSKLIVTINAPTDNKKDNIKTISGISAMIMTVIDRSQEFFETLDTVEFVLEYDSKPTGVMIKDYLEDGKFVEKNDTISYEYLDEWCTIPLSKYSGEMFDKYIQDINNDSNAKASYCALLEISQ